MVDGTLRYILSIEALLLRELKDERRDSLFELASLSSSMLFSLVVCEGGAGDELFFRETPLSLIKDGDISSEFCDERGETRVATGCGIAMLFKSVFACTLDELLRLSSAPDSSFREGEVCRLVGSQLFRENIFRAPAPLPCALLDAAPGLSSGLLALSLSDSSISFTETKRAADIRFFVFELARRKSSMLAFWTELLILAGFWANELSTLSEKVLLMP